MSNSNNNNARSERSKNSNNNKKIDAKRKMAEMTLSRRLKQVWTHHLEMVAEKHSNNNSNNTTDSGSNSNNSQQAAATAAAAFQLDPAERKILYEINNIGIVEGLVAGVATLTLLRWSRSYFQRSTFLQRRFTSTASSRSSSSPFHQQQQPQPYLQQQQHYPGGPGAAGGFGGWANHTNTFNVFRARPLIGGGGRRLPITALFGWLVDCLAAFTTCVAVSVAYTDMDQILQKMAQVPLVQGRSVVARELCPPLLNEIQKIMVQQQQPQQQRNNETTTTTTATASSSNQSPPYNNKTSSSITSSRPAPAFFDLSSSSSSRGNSGSDDGMDNITDDMNDDDMNDDDLYSSPRQLLQHPQTAQLGAFVKFAENCQRRQILERSLLKLRREQGEEIAAEDSSSLLPVEIPAPGVPHDMPVDLFTFSSSNGIEENENEREQNEEQNGQDAAAAAAAALDFYDPNSGGGDSGEDDIDEQGAWSDQDSDQRR